MDLLISLFVTHRIFNESVEIPTDRLDEAIKILYIKKKRI
jgi:hypothetical protein